MNAESRALLKAYFGDDLSGVYVCDSTNWQPQPAATAKLDPGAGWYWCPSRLSGLSPKGQRVLANAVSVHALVIDDVGVKIDREAFEMFASAPTTSVETSPGNWQAGYRLEGVSVEAFNALRARLPWAADGVDCVHWWRLPGGINQKPENKGFKVGPVTWGKGELGWLPPHPRPGAPTAPKAGGSKDEQLATEEQVAAVLRALPNRYPDHLDPWCADEPAWWRMCAAIKGALGERGLPYWLDWNEGVPQGPEYDPVDRWHGTAADYIGWKALKKLAEKHASPADYAIIVNATARDEFTDTGFEPDPGSTALPDEEPVVASTLAALKWKDHKTLAVRPWLYGKRLVRGYVSGTVAAGGVGKSSLALVEAISMATGKDLLGVGADKMPHRPLRVYLWNGEDTREEMELRVFAACLHHGVNEPDIGTDRLFIDSGTDRPIKLVIPDGRGVKVNEKLVLTMIATLRKNKIDVVSIDPLVSAHHASENDNIQMDLVVKTLARIAKEANVAIEIVHHTRKSGGTPSDPSVDDARGASAVVNATRNTRVLTQMSKEVGKRHGIHDYKRYFCVHRDAVKANLTPPLTSDQWYRLVDVDMQNGSPFGPDGPVPSEHVGVVENWSLTAENADKVELIKQVQDEIKASGREWKHHWQSPDWVGRIIGRVLGIDITNVGGRKMVEDVVDKWVGAGWFVLRERLDAQRKKKVFVDVSKDPEAWEDDEK